MVYNDSTTEIPLASAATAATDQFINERRYLKGVTAKTLDWYKASFTAFTGCTTQDHYKQRIRVLIERGCSPVSINTYTRCINAYLALANAGYKLPK